MAPAIASGSCCSFRIDPASNRCLFLSWIPRLFFSLAPMWRNQNISFSANWIWRELVAVVVMTPAEELMLVPEKTVLVGEPKFA